MKKICIVLFLIIISVALIAVLFGFSYRNLHTSQTVILGDEIILPDRIVYKNSNNEYFEFLKDSSEYDSLIELISSSLHNFDENGDVLSQDIIDTIHQETFLEFDYETVSKNYIIPFGDTLKNEMVKLSDTGGKICSINLRNIKKIKSELDNNLTTNLEPCSLDYTELLSKNSFSLDYKYTEQFDDQINYKIYQVKIQDIKTYERFEAMCNLSFDKPITEDIFTDNDLILTVSLVPKITVKVSVGNIRYTYESLPNTYGAQYTAHLLVVSKIVNTDCIYNTDLSTVSEQATLNEFQISHDERVNNLDENLFVKDFESFYDEYTNSTNTITDEKAKEIAIIAFEEASYIVGNYNENSESYEIKSVHPTNLFTRKYYETDYVTSYVITAYCFRRTDDMGNGVEIYIDNKLGKIIGGRAFGD